MLVPDTVITPQPYRHSQHGLSQGRTGSYDMLRPPWSPLNGGDSTSLGFLLHSFICNLIGSTPLSDRSSVIVAAAASHSGVQVRGRTVRVYHIPSGPLPCVS
jgi:hypothetical protein